MNDGSLNEKIDLERKGLTPEEFLDKLRTALARNGDFPASAKIVTELRMLTQDPSTTAAQLAEVILREPSLGVRLLHLVNSSFYKRAKPVTTISQAIVQIGMKPLAEMCGGLILLQRFVPEARQNSAFAACLRKSIVTSILSSSLSLQETQDAKNNAPSKNTESGYLAGTMAEIGVLLMAFYFPQIYDSAVKRSEARKQELGLSIKQILGLSPAQLSTEVIRTLNLPQYYADVVTYADQILSDRNKFVATGVDAEMVKQSRNLSAAVGVSDIVTMTRPAQDIVEGVKKVRECTDIKPEYLTTVIRDLQNHVHDHCSVLDLKLPQLPDELSNIEIGSAITDQALSLQDTEKKAPSFDLGERQAEFEQYLEDIRQGILNNEPTSNILTSVMEACAYCLHFDRVLLLLAIKGRRNLAGRIMLGSAPNFDPKSCSRPLGDEAHAFAPDNNAFMHGRPVFQGDSLFGDGWPIAAIPVGSGKKAIGVVYCERTVKGGTDLSLQEQAAIVMLANLLDKSIQRVASSV